MGTLHASCCCCSTIVGLLFSVLQKGLPHHAHSCAFEPLHTQSLFSAVNFASHFPEGEKSNSIKVLLTFYNKIYKVSAFRISLFFSVSEIISALLSPSAHCLRVFTSGITPSLSCSIFPLLRIQDALESPILENRPKKPPLQLHPHFFAPLHNKLHGYSPYSFILSYSSSGTSVLPIPLQLLPGPPGG
jgi:hypothetical protein